PGSPGRSGESGSVERCWTWTTGHPAPRHAARSRATLASASGVLRRPYLGWSSPCWTSTTRRAARTGTIGGGAPSAGAVRTALLLGWERLALGVLGRLLLPLVRG